jgi:hypothetical protein
VAERGFSCVAVTVSPDEEILVGTPLSQAIPAMYIGPN